VCLPIPGSTARGWHAPLRRPTHPASLTELGCSRRRCYSVSMGLWCRGPSLGVGAEVPDDRSVIRHGGRSDAEIARLLDMRAQAVRNWHHVWTAGGPDALLGTGSSARGAPWAGPASGPAGTTAPGCQGLRFRHRRLDSGPGPPGRHRAVLCGLRLAVGPWSVSTFDTRPLLQLSVGGEVHRAGVWGHSRSGGGRIQ
jgi:hypothetical protein